MTQEERALTHLKASMPPMLLLLQIGSPGGQSWLVQSLLSFADAEAAAMRERAAGVADAHVAMGYMSGRERDYCHGHGDEIAELIRALPTTEVGNG